ncbi:MAG: hypothetical protein RL011_880 [Pseudomonadota bacterium]
MSPGVISKLSGFIADRHIMAFYEKSRRWVSGLSNATLWLLALWCILLFCSEQFGLGDYLQQHITSKINFNLRHALIGESPLDPKIKIYAVDDPTAAMRGDVRLFGRDLVRVLRAIDARSPRKILLDAMFSQRSDYTRDNADLVTEIASLRTPIVTGAMISSTPIAHRTQISETGFKSLIGAKDPLTLGALEMKPAYIYGPEGSYLKAFTRLGHFVEIAEHYMAPVILVNGDTLVPHLSIHAADDLKVIDGKLRINDTEVTLDSRGLVPVDYLSSEMIAPRVRSLGRFFSGDDSIFNDVKAGDTVIVLTEYTSGVTRFISSPFGLIPSPFTLISCINSVLRGQWLKSVGHAYLLILGMSLIGLVIGFTTSHSRFLVVLMATLTVTISCFIYLFIWWGIELKWLVPVLGLLGSALIGLGEQRQKESSRRIFLESERQTAAVLQRDFLPALRADHPNFELAATYIAAETIGGDWYSYGIIENRWLYVHLGDVTGHGSASAMLASFAKGATDALHESHRRDHGHPAPLDLVHECLDKIMSTSSGENLYMTMLSMTIDLDTGAYTYLNSGHEPPIVVAADKTTILSQPTNNLLGHFGGVAKTTLGAGQLKPSDLVILFSDGLLDATCPRDKKPSLRLLTKLIHSADISSAANLRELLDLRCAGQLQASRKANFSDDVTFVVLKLKTFKFNDGTATEQSHQSA